MKSYRFARGSTLRDAWRVIASLENVITISSWLSSNGVRSLLHLSRDTIVR